MDIATLTTFFMWCTIINGGSLLFWSAICAFAPDMVYRKQKMFFPITRETWDVLIFCFLGAFKLFVIGFNAVPYIALLIIG